MTEPTAADASSSPVRLALEQGDRAPGQARRGTRAVLLSWRLPALVDTVVLAVSELVTNAVRYGRPPLLLELRRGPTSVAVRVHDANPAEPPPPGGSSAPDGAESGRGMDIVGALAAKVGCEQVPGDGKVVYASFGVNAGGPPPP